VAVVVEVAAVVVVVELVAVGLVAPMLMKWYSPEPPKSLHCLQSNNKPFNALAQ
jgi:hypothetical protein